MQLILCIHIFCHLVHNLLPYSHQSPCLQYDYTSHEVHFIGSVAYYYKDVLAQAADEMGIRLGTILKSPMEGLIAYHR